MLDLLEDGFGCGGPLERSSRTRETVEVEVEAPPSAKIVRPVGRDPGDAFYAELARIYTVQSAWHNAPNAAIADASNVGKTTVDMWVRKARRRGLLRPAQRGVAG